MPEISKPAQSICTPNSTPHLVQVVDTLLDTHQRRVPLLVLDDVPLGAADGFIGLEVRFPVDGPLADGRGFGAAEFLDMRGLRPAWIFADHRQRIAPAFPRVS